ncbi:MAG: polyisoprenoid-binding protein [Xanthomonadaceae bacterium]|nr:polyisoprenoid-binding protein [Xanthomonadaceae bacterium]
MRFAVRHVIASSTLLFMLTCASAGATDFVIDTVHTQIYACVSHLGFSAPCARFKIQSGFFHFDEGNWTTARVDALVDTQSADLGDAAWNDTVRSWQFLDAGKYPQARFVSKSVEQTGMRTGIAHGALTLRGVTRPLDLRITLNRAGLNPYALRYTAGFSATATLKRSDFGMTKYLPDIGYEVSIRIEAEGLRGKPPPVQTAPAKPET